MSNLLNQINAPLIIAVAVPVLSGMMIGTATTDSVKTWYPSIKKPSWTPPNWVFPVAWTSLYMAMGYASYRVYEAGQANRLVDNSPALKLYAGQLALNLAWTPLFFLAHRLGAAAFDIVALLGMIVATAIEFGKIDKVAGYLMWPYIAWVSYASSISIYVWLNNTTKGKHARKEL
ncbi:translocator protein [Powellomyces hirtus]|nr:translocator protein [Powellomyces hirtus]